MRPVERRRGPNPAELKKLKKLKKLIRILCPKA